MPQASSRHIRFRGRSFPVLTLEPELPIEDWFEQLDGLLAQSPAFFAKKSIVIDLAKLTLEPSQLSELLENLSRRGIRVMGLSGVDPSWASDELPPILAGGRATPQPPAEADSVKDAGPGSLTSSEEAAFKDIAKSLGSDGATGVKSAAPAPSAAPLILLEPVRSGQSIYHPEGDVTVIGSVASGAEIMAGGSVHVYGTLRGRAMAGAYGEKRARIFCRRLEAELLSVCGVYLTAEEISANMQSQPIQAWLDNETVKIARLD
ncbi:septum site-determining protein MinC [Methylocystis sp. B8]|uniref:septum site-determining protein MinC n=1 Tax=Methylocystis sp. B8 TaxID=544938 RepID=UPI0010FE7136|nr:septum site-determining protein MinC [Methylocystis sp. B8]TLG76965.1 septum formation inhibitor MinC [Methylocystis sp. B8]